MDTKAGIRATYRRRARLYDPVMQLYRLFGFSYDHYRRLAVDELSLSPGDTVVELAYRVVDATKPLEEPGTESDRGAA